MDNLTNLESIDYTEYKLHIESTVSLFGHKIQFLPKIAFTQSSLFPTANNIEYGKASERFYHRACRNKSR